MNGRKYFGTDGIRGKANIEPMTADVAMRVGRAAAYVFRSRDRLRRILIGKDTRRSSYMLEYALAAGVCSAGADAYVIGPMPTAGIAFLTRDMRADAGVVISASHNPFEDNGIKFFDGNGFKLPDEVEARIEEVMDTREAEAHPATGADVGKATRIDDASGRYIVFLKKSFPANLTLEGVKIVVDCANGASYKVAPAVFQELGASVTVLGTRPNGTNINQGCGAMHPEAMAAAVREVGADVGIALDGDADRLVLADETGRIVGGDFLIAGIGRQMIKEGRLAKKTVVATVMSNFGLDAAMEAVGGRVVRADVGDRYVLEKMQTEGYNFGGEQSGHMIFLDEHSTGDGIMSAVQVLAMLVRERIPLSKFASSMTACPQVLKNVSVREKRPFEELPGVVEELRSAERDLAGKGRVLLRYSGTELRARVMVEGPDEEGINRMCTRIAARIADAIGASG